MAKFPIVLAGQDITADLLNSMLPDVVAKATTESVTSSTAMQNDDELFSSVTTNATYEVTLHLFHDSATAADITVGWSGPTGSTMNWGMVGVHVNQISSTTVEVVTMPQFTIGNTNDIGGGASIATYALLAGVLTTTTTAGTLNFRWAQRASSATATNVRAGSTLIVRRIA